MVDVVVALFLAVVFSAAVAQERSEVESPDVEFLEFLGEWVSDDGEWLDPEALEDGGILDAGDFGQVVDHD